MSDSTRRNALFFSPIPSHPISRGNRSRIVQTARLFRRAGWNISLATGARSSSHPEIQQFWDAIYPLTPAPRWRPNNQLAPFDSWYSDGLGQSLRHAVEHFRAEVVVFNYIFHSQALEDLPSGVWRVIDTHDVFSERTKNRSTRGGFLRRGFFQCTAEDEKRYLDRADIALAISDQDASSLRALGTSAEVISLPFLPEAARPVKGPRRDMSDTLRVGIVMSSNDANFQGLLALIDAIDSRKSEAHGFVIEVAGEIGMRMRLQAPLKKLGRPWLRFAGVVPDISRFYERCDVVVVPILEGSGVSIKFAEALAHEVPVMSTRVGSRGFGVTHPLHQLTDLDSLVDALSNWSPGHLAKLGAASKELRSVAEQEVSSAWGALAKRLQNKPPTRAG